MMDKLNTRLNALATEMKLLVLPTNQTMRQVLDLLETLTLKATQK